MSEDFKRQHIENGRPQALVNPLLEIDQLRARVTQLEKHIHYPHSETAMKEAAARAQALKTSMAETSGEYFSKLDMAEVLDQAREVMRDAVPQKTDTRTVLDLTSFAKRLLNPEDLGHAVTFEVRQAARRALGRPEVKEYDL